MRLKRALTTASLTAASVLLASTNAIAYEATPAADTVATAIAEARPGTADTADPIETSAGFLVAALASDTTATIPAEGGGAVTLDKAGRAPIAVSLPVGVQTYDADIAGDGTVVYPAIDDVTVAVQALENGKVSVQTILTSDNAPTTYAYTLDDDVTAELRADGGADLVATSEVGRFIVGTVDAPWAVDANGKSVPTRYTTTGNTLTQIVSAPSDAAYPIVADPTWGHTYLVPTMYLSKAETNSIAGDIDAAYVACAAAGAVFGAAAAAICAGNALLVKQAAQRAKSKGVCIKVLINPLGVAPQEFSANCK